LRASIRLVLAFVLTLSASPLAAQAAPEEVARQYFTAVRANDYRAAAALMHPAALDQFRDFFRSLAAADVSGETVKTMFGVRSTSEFNALSSQDVFARLLGTMTSMSPEMKEAMSSMRASVVGTVPEGADTVHVMYRMTMGVQGVEVTKMEVLSLQRSGTRWMAMLTGDMQGMIRAMSAQRR
jgi:2-keto-3-deoxy-galactonokinase